jgi:transcriptional regulator with XRE-family HTH domain
MQTKLRRMTLPELLERYRVYTIRELSRRTGLSRQHAWNLWHGAASLGRLTLERLHEALGIPFEELHQVKRATPAKKRGPKPRPQAPKGRSSTPPTGEATP